MVKTKPLISVIVPCYNKEKSIQITMTSLLNQTIINDIQIILINDCSTDNTQAILEEYRDNNPNVNILVHKQPKNMGIFAGRVVGVSISNGLFIAMLDADDWVDRNYYEDLLFEALPNKISREIFIKYKQDDKLYQLFKKQYDKCIDIVYNCNVVKYYAPDKQYDAKDSILSHHPYGTYLVDPSNKLLRGIFVSNWHIVWNKLFKHDNIINITYIPQYRIDIFEDILISFICYMNAKYIKVVNTNGKIYYNLTDEVDHLTNKITSNEKKLKTEASTATVFMTLSALITEYNKFEWYNLIKSYRSFYINFYLDTLKPSFKERFTDDDFYYVGMDRNGFNHNQEYFNKSASFENINKNIVDNFIGKRNMASLARPTYEMIENERQKALTVLECFQNTHI